MWRDHLDFKSQIVKQKVLTHSIVQMRPLFFRSKWTMGEILAFLA